MTPPLEKKKCQICCTEIDVDARKCTECSSWQGIRRIYSISNEALALIIALFAVIGLAGDNLKKIIYPSHNIEILHFEILEYDKVTIDFSNTGTLPGKVYNGSINIINNHNNDSYILFLKKKDGENIKPGGTIITNKYQISCVMESGKCQEAKEILTNQNNSIKSTAIKISTSRKNTIFSRIFSSNEYNQKISTVRFEINDNKILRQIGKAIQ